MLATVQDLARLIEELAPRNLAEDWDNVGLQVGDPAAPVRQVLVALDLTDRVIDEARELGAELVVVHHPLLFQPLRQLSFDQAPARLIRRLVRQDLAVYAAHTNLDKAAAGVSAILAERLGLAGHWVLQPFPPGQDYATDNRASAATGLGRIGALPEPCCLEEFAWQVKQRLGLDSVRVAGEGDRIIRRVAVCGGSGTSLMRQAAARGADVLVTGDVRYHDAQTAADLGLALIDAGHGETEIGIVPALTRYLNEKMAGEYETVALASKAQFIPYRTL